MSKWADYCITAVQFNDDGTHINRVRAREDLGAELGTEAEYTRSQVISAIARGTTFATVVWDEKSKAWMLGASVAITTLSTSFLKTKPDRTTVDNLDNLPTF